METAKEPASAVTAKMNDIDPSSCSSRLTNPHAYHQNLPRHHINPDDGIPYITTFAENKAKAILRLVRSIVLTEDVYHDLGSAQNDSDDEEEEEVESIFTKTPQTMTSIVKKCARLHSQLSTLFGLKHNGLSQSDLCEILLHVLRLLTATVTITEESPSVDVGQGVAKLSIDNEADSGDSVERASERRVTLHFDDVGRILKVKNDQRSDADEEGNDDSHGDGPLQLEKDLSQPFALPSPARESLLSVAILILSKKCPLRSVSNTALCADAENATDGGAMSNVNQGTGSEKRYMLCFNWRTFLRMLLRTAPYLDEHKVGTPPTNSASRHNTVLKRTVNLIRHSRRFFDQGLRPGREDEEGVKLKDTTAREVWEMVKNDLLYHTHSNSCFRAVILLYLFQPTKCTADFYLEVMPLWLESWSSVDRSPEFDFLWLVLFCRARKYLSPEAYDWGPLRRRLLTLCGYWLQIPVGGISSDTSFPRAALPRSRGFPARLKSFVGSGSSYQEGIDFVGKVSKLLVHCIGREGFSKVDNTAAANNGLPTGDGSSRETATLSVTSGTDDILRFLSFVGPYFNPSNTGSWTFPLGALLHYLSYEICHRMGIAAGMKALKCSHPKLASDLCREEPYLESIEMPGSEIVAILDGLLPLCQLALYSKNSHVSRAGESALLYLTQIDPVHVSPQFLDFAASALDISAVNLSHQAPAALSAMTRLVQPTLRRNPSILLERVPDLLRLTLAGIDSNDQNKTLRTLIFYRNLVSWLPVGSASQPATNTEEDDRNDGTVRMGKNLMETLTSMTSSTEYCDALSQLSERSLLHLPGVPSQSDDDNSKMLLEETALSMTDWSLAFLDRVYSLLRTAGEQEKVGKSPTGVASRHSSADAQVTRNFSRVLKECLVQYFSSMDSGTHEFAIRSVIRFLKEETHPNAAKDASALCQAAASARFEESNVTSSPGLDALVPLLTDDLEHHSAKTVIYRLRCLAGAVRCAGESVLKHRSAITSAIEYALSSRHGDKMLFKTGCKLLRHTLASQCEAYPVALDSQPCARLGSSSSSQIGKSAQLRGEPIKWHVPSGEQVDFTVELLDNFALTRLDALGKVDCADTFVEIVDMEATKEAADASIGDVRNDPTKSNHTGYTVSVPEWRRCLRILRYALRGCSGILLDADNNTTSPVPDQKVEKLSSFASSVEEECNEMVGGDVDPHEEATRALIRSAHGKTQETLLGLRGKLCVVITSIMSLVASETAESESNVNGGGYSSYPSTSDDDKEVSKFSERDGSTDQGQSISSDVKICKEAIELALLLLTRRGSSFRSQNAKSLWRAQKQMLTDYVLAAETDFIASSLQRGGLYADGDTLYKDGEDGGKTIPRRLLTARLEIFLQAVQRNSSFEIPRRLRRNRVRFGVRSKTSFTLDTDLEKLLGTLRLCQTGTAGVIDPLNAYESMIDGLFAMSCHPNANVRNEALGVVDYALTRFGWVVRDRAPRLLAAISLRDEDKRGVYGIPSCSQLSKQVNAQGKHKRLAEVLKGVCGIFNVPRFMKELLGTEKNRFLLVKTLCGTQPLISILPAEEMQKMVYYLLGIFSSFRQRFFSLPRATEKEQEVHEVCLAFLLDLISGDDSRGEANIVITRSIGAGSDGATSSDAVSAEGENAITDKPDISNADSNSMHWRNRLIVGWFLTNFVDESDLVLDDPKIAAGVWTTCFHLIEQETGQPLQRVALGMLGRLVSLSLVDLSAGCDDAFEPSSKSDQSIRKPDLSVLCQQLSEKKFCRALGTALVFDHKEDNTVGGGHQAQWSAGVEEILRDAASNIAPKTLFPFQRTSRFSPLFKLQHAQMVQAILLAVGLETARAAADYLLEHATELASSPPSEDQKNQQCTSAEIFGGVCRALLLYSKTSEGQAEVWEKFLLPFLDEVIPTMPIALIGAFFDAFRYGIHHLPPSHFLPVTTWVIGKVEKTLWQSNKESNIAEGDGSQSDSREEKTPGASEERSSSSASAEGFALQSKLLALTSAVLIELDDEADSGAMRQLPWYTKVLLDQGHSLAKREGMDLPVEELRSSWSLVSSRLLPCLLNALGHPFEKCREYIAGCLFRICYCHRKVMKQSMASPERRRSLEQSDNEDPGLVIVNQLRSIGGSDAHTFKEQQHARITARKFIVYCVHLGDSKHEFADFIIPLLPLAFESIKVTAEESDGELSAANRVLEAEVVKGYRYSIAEVSSSCLITYGVEADMSRVLATLNDVTGHECWQVRQAVAHFLRCFQGAHKFLFARAQAELATSIVVRLLSDERREVSSAATAALTGIFAATPLSTATALVRKYVKIANKSVKKRKKKKGAVGAESAPSLLEGTAASEKEKERVRKQQTSVFFLCAAVLARPYDTPAYIPEALAALSKHSYERSAPLGVREAVKMCCAEFKRTHMSDNWEVHRKQFTQEQLEALEDVVSTPHYYA